MGFLNIYVRMDDRTGTLWRFGSNIGNTWNLGQANIARRSNANNFTIVFESMLYVLNYKKKILSN